MDLDQSSWEKQALTDQKGIVLDVRTPEEFENSRIPNSKNIDFYNPHNFMLEIEKLDKLLKDGILTQEEFDKAKKKLLDN